MPLRRADLDHVGAYNFKLEIEGVSAAGKDEHYYSIILENVYQSCVSDKVSCLKRLLAHFIFL